LKRKLEDLTALVEAQADQIRDLQQQVNGIQMMEEQFHESRLAYDPLEQADFREVLLTIAHEDRAAWSGTRAWRFQDGDPHDGDPQEPSYSPSSPPPPASPPPGTPEYHR
jgi:hypothetical protein